MNNKDMAITAAASTDGGDGGWAERPAAAAYPDKDGLQRVTL